MTSEENFDFFNRETYKSRNKKSKKITTGLTCNNASKRSQLRYNSDALLTESYFGLPKIAEAILTDKNLLQSHTNNYDNSSIHILNRSSQHVFYSMNKKKRWNLPHILQDYAKEFAFSATKQIDEDANNFGITAYFMDKTGRGKQEAFGYFDNNETSYAKSINPHSLRAQINQIPRRNTRLMERERRQAVVKRPRNERILFRKEKKQSHHSKRQYDNSWLDITQNDDQLHFRNANKVEFKFYGPRKILNHTKCNPLGKRYTNLCDDKDKYRFSSYVSERMYRKFNKEKKMFSIADKVETSESFQISTENHAELRRLG